MGFGSIAKVLAKCNLKYYRISEGAVRARSRWDKADQVGRSTAADQAMPEGGRIHDAADQASAEHQPRISHTPEKLQAEQPALRTFSEKVQQGLIGDFADDAMTEELFQLSTSANQTGSCRYEVSPESGHPITLDRLDHLHLTDG